MSFLEIQYSELLVELSEEQQETVAGGEVYQYSHSYQDDTSEHSREVNGTENGTEAGNSTEDPAPFNGDVFLMPLRPLFPMLYRRRREL